MTQQFNSWLAKFDSAADAYQSALFSGATLSGAEREGYAKQFLDWVPVFKDGERYSVELLQTELESKEHHRYNAAARLLIEMVSRGALLKLSEQIIESGKPSLTDQNLRLLWLTLLSPSDLFDKSDSRWEKLPLVRAILTQPSAQASMLLTHILDTKGSWTKFAIEAASAWIETAQLKQFINKPPMIEIIGGTEFSDRRFVVALHLGLRGDHEAIQFLEDSANGPNLVQAAFACHELGLLALPSTMGPAERLLSSKNTIAIPKMLGTSLAIGSPLLFPALIDLIDWRAFTYFDSHSIPDWSIQTLRHIIGGPLDQLNDEYVPYSSPAEYTDSFREQAKKLCLETIAHFQLDRRYHAGRMITLADLVEDLLSPHSGPQHKAAYQLKAITGEDYGFKLDADLITNLPAISAWRKRAENPDPLTPGGWAFRGAPISGPQLA